MTLDRPRQASAADEGPRGRKRREPEAGLEAARSVDRKVQIGELEDLGTVYMAQSEQAAARPPEGIARSDSIGAGVLISQTSAIVGTCNARTPSRVPTARSASFPRDPQNAIALTPSPNLLRPSAPSIAENALAWLDRFVQWKLL